MSSACAAHAAEGVNTDYPTRVVRVVVPTSPGGIVDSTTRLVVQRIIEGTGKTLVVDNRPGASNNIGTELVARAPADGYTVLSATLPLVVNPSIFAHVPYNVETDFAPISQLVAAPYVLVVRPKLEVQSVKELVALSKASPRGLNFSSGGTGTNLHMAAELFRARTGVRMTHVAYKGGGPALIAVINGEADLSFPSLAQALPQAKGGRIRILAVTTARRAAILPDVPTMSEAGVLDYTFSSWVGMLAPAGTPAAAIGWVNAQIAKALARPDLARKLTADGTEIVASSPSEFHALLAAESARWARVVKASGIKID
jgi:tripartite-type tricarboxylate transporter receptor subunit TctC